MDKEQLLSEIKRLKAEVEELKREKKLQTNSIGMSSEDFRNFANGMDSMLVTVSKSGKILFSNIAMNRALGYSSDELVGKPVSTILDSGEKILSKQAPCTAATGLQRIYDNNSRDFKKLLEEAPLGVLLINDQGTICSANISVQSLLGYREEELVGSSVDKLVPEQTRKSHSNKVSDFMKFQSARFMGSGQVLEAVTSSGSTFQTDIALIPITLSGADHVVCVFLDEISDTHWNIIKHTRFGRLLTEKTFGDLIVNFISKPGNRIPALISGTQFRASSSDTISTVLIANNVSEQHALQEKLRSTKNLLHRVIDTSDDLISVRDIDGKIILCNKAYAALHNTSFQGIQEKNASGDNWVTAFVDTKESNTKDSLEIEHRTILAGEILRNPREAVRVSGEERIFDTIKKPLRDENGEVAGVLGIARDVTNRQRIEDELLKSQKLFNEAQRIGKVGNWELNSETDDLFWSDGVFDIFGIDKNKFKASYDTFLNTIHPEDREFVDLAYSESIRNKTPCDITHRLLLADGTEKIVNEFFQTFYSTTGEPIRSIGRVQDVTEQIKLQEEKENLEVQLRKSEKLKTIGTLAGGIAHDFNNILTPIIGFADLALSKVPEDEPLSKDLQVIARAAGRASKLVKQLLLFSKQEEQQFKSVQLNELLYSTINFLRSALPANVVIKTAIEDSIFVILADATQLEQVIINLMTNAWQAMDKTGGTLTISLSKITVDEKPHSHAYNLGPGQYVQLDVTDTGVGMTPEIKRRLFEPFFTTKDVDKGTGLGLSVVHGIVTSHGGDIEVESTPGAGSTFTVFLPVFVEKSVEPDSNDTPTLSSGTESILLIDDEISVTNVMERILKFLGYQTRAFNDSALALDEFKNNTQTYDLILSDLSMPGMNGIELARQIQIIRPHTPVIIATGFNDAEMEEDVLVDCGIRRILTKPISVNNLASQVREVLNEHN